MAYTHSFEIEFEGSGRMEGEIDFANPNNGVKFTKIQEDTELHIKALREIVSILNNTKGLAVTLQGLQKLEISVKP